MHWKGIEILYEDKKLDHLKVYNLNISLFIKIEIGTSTGTNA